MIIAGLLFLVLQTILVFFRPRYFLFIYVLFYSSFLGLLPKQIIVGSYEIGFFYQNIIMLVTYFIHLKRTRKFPRYINILLISILLFYFFGIFYPVVNGSSTILESIIGSKEFSSLFLLHFLFVNKKSISFSYIIKILSFFGYYFLLVLFVFVVFNYIPPQYIKDMGRLQYYSPVLLSLFLFLKMSQANSQSKKLFALLLLALWTIGMFKEGHVAITITTTLGCFVVLYRVPIISLIKNYKRILLAFGFIGLLLIILPTRKYISDFNQIPNISSRELYNAARMIYIKSSPFFGYGFLYKNDFSLAGNNVYNSTLSVIDSGYIDLLTKFGYIGTTFFLIVLIPPFFNNHREDILITSLKIFFLQFFAVNLTWAVFSFSMGTIALSLAIYLTYLYNNNTKYQLISRSLKSV